MRSRNRAVAAYQALAGAFVDDDIFLGYARDQVFNSPDEGKGLVYDGHLRRGSQVSPFIDITHDAGKGIGGVLLVHTDLSKLEQRLLGRLSCKEGCGDEYNLTEPRDSSRYPAGVHDGPDGLAIGYCRKCDNKLLTRRDDDRPTSVINRISAFSENANGLLRVIQEQDIPIYVVTGEVPSEAYSKPLIRSTISDSLNAYNARVLESFSWSK